MKISSCQVVSENTGTTELRTPVTFYISEKSSCTSEIINKMKIKNTDEVPSSSLPKNLIGPASNLSIHDVH